MHNERQLADKVALVFGGSKGIGAAIVTKLAADGASVALKTRVIKFDPRRMWSDRSGSPSATSYSKSQTTMVEKLLTGELGSDEALETRMLLAEDHPTFKGRFDELVERLLRPIRFGEGVEVATALDLVVIFTRGLLARGLRPKLLCRKASLDVGLVPRVFEILRRHPTQEKPVIGPRRKRQAES